MFNLAKVVVRPGAAPLFRSATALIGVLVGMAPAVQARVVQFAFGDLEAGRTNNVAVQLQADGDENALGFSIQFDSRVVEFKSIRTGSAATAASVNFNTNQIAQGRIGVALALSAGESFPAGARSLIEIAFAGKADSAGATANFTIIDTPIARETVDATAAPLSTLYPAGTIVIRAPNAPPTISSIADVPVLEDSGSHSVSFTLADDRSSPSSLDITLRSANEQIVPTPTVRVGASEAERVLTFSSAPNRFGNVTIFVEVSDGELVRTNSFIVQVQPVNDAPVANAQSVAATEDTAKAITLAGTDIESSPLTFAIVTAPTKGSLSGTAPNLTYTPNSNANGPDSFTFKVRDGLLDSAPTTVNITVAAVNDAPSANAQAVSAIEDTPKSIVLAGTDIEGNALTFAVVTQPANGTLSGTPPNLTYTPNLNANGSDTFTFKANDGQIDSTPATVSITIAPVNDAPSANAQSVAVTEDTPKAIALSGSDIEGSALTFTIVAAPTKGTLSGSAPNLTYTPALNVSGSDSFTFKTSDGQSDSAPATVSIAIAAVNDTPIASPESVAATEDTPEAIVLHGSDVEGSALTYTIVTAPTKGSLSGTAPNVTYTPNLNANGSDSFTFKVNDGQLDSPPATVSIAIAAVNDAPSANAQSVPVTEDTPKAVTLTGSDIEGSALTYAIVAAPAKGTLSGTPPNLTYTPNLNANGNDSFTFKANDGQLDSAPAAVTIAIAAVNDAPVASAQTAAATEDTARTITLTGTDIEANALTFAILSSPAKGTLSGTPPNLTYTPNANVNGSDTFTFKVNDGQFDSAPATVGINIAAVNDPPTIAGPADQLLYVGEQGAPVVFTIADIDTPDQSLTVLPDSSDTTLLPTQNVTVVGTGLSRTVAVRAPADRTGTARVTLTVSDGQGGSAAASFSVTISRRRVRPIAATGVWGGTLTVPLRFETEGNENSASFSLDFNASAISSPVVQLGAAAAGAALSMDASAVNAGRLGITVKLPDGQAFPSGNHDIATARFTVNVAPGLTATTLRINDSPVALAAQNVNRQPLPLFSQDAVMLLLQGFEADVSPRPNGTANGEVSIADWVQVGRFVARLDVPGGPGEFMRADCAPRFVNDILTLGNGSLTVLDWIQAGRYAAGLDPSVLAGGPVGPSLLHSPVPQGGAATAGLQRIVRLGTSSLLAQVTNTVSLVIDSSGDENAVGFSIEFDPLVLRFIGGRLAANLGASANFNSSSASEGRVGIAIALPAGTAFAAGINPLVDLDFAVGNSTSGSQTQIRFRDQPIVREIGSAAATALAGQFESGTLTIASTDLRLGMPRLQDNGVSFEVSGQSGRNYVIEATADFTAWDIVASSAIPSVTPFAETIAAPPIARFYRARYVP